MTPQFEHDCQNCQFLGHWYNHDVYLCAGAESDLGGSLVCRYGDRPPDYASAPIAVWADPDRWDPSHRIGGRDTNGDVGDWSMPYSQFIFSDHGGEANKAAVIGMLKHYGLIMKERRDESRK